MNNNSRTTPKPAREAESARQIAIDRMIAAKLQATINRGTAVSGLEARKQ